MIRQGRSDGNDLAALAMHNQIWQRISTLACTSTHSEYLDAHQLEIFPNPAREGVYLRNLPDGVRQVQLLDGVGRVHHLPVHNQWVALDSFTSGFYQLRVVHHNKLWTAKLIL
ncbi:MAG: T9SS C-terminal target domain-containing protein [Bacteroidetes bacterium]|nr:MAG: T9SS C-terminal target domain-containing protein [Bacteroidota bacterium]